MKIWDCVIIGGGPAGQSAAIYLARFNRQILVLDRGTSRTNSHEHNENYLGFVEGIAARELAKRGRQQAERLGATFVADEAQLLGHAPLAELGQPRFQVQGLVDTYWSRSLIIATGVTDLYPNLTNYKTYLGKSLFWCITCDGPKTQNKKLVVVGNSDEAACTALQFKLYTNQITLITNYASGHTEIDEKWRTHLREHDVQLKEGEVAHLIGKEGWVEKVRLLSGEEVSAEIIMNLQGAIPNSSLAASIGISINDEGYIETDDEQRTNIPAVYAVGDVTRRFSHQIITAAHEGSMAAQACNYDLYEPWQSM